MLSRYLAFISLCLLLLTGLWLLPVNGARASAAPTPTPLPPTTDFAPRTGSLADYFSLQTSQPSSVVSLAIRSELDPERFMADLEEFQAKRSQALTHSGWLHRLSRHMKLENGLEVRWQVEGWYEFDAGGNLSAAYERSLDADGNGTSPLHLVELPGHNSSIVLPLTQESLLPSLDSSSGISAGSPSFDFGYRSFAGETLADGWLSSSQILYENCWYMGETYNLSNGSIRVSALFFPDTGKLRTLNLYDISGPSLRLIASLELPIEEHLAQRPSIIP
jgi:hypothetical protein